MSKSILFLSDKENRHELINELKKRNCKVTQTYQELINIDNYDLIISYGYRHIIKKEILKKIHCPIINLHISYLPWNRGAHPNFWSFYEDTPAGVTIHLIDEDIDTGNILFQKIVNFENNEITFKKTYQRLKKEIEKLFIDNIDLIIQNKFSTFKQVGIGSFHKKSDLPKNFKGWDSNITNEIKRLKSLKS